MASKLETMIYNAYKGGADDSEPDDTSTVESDDIKKMDDNDNGNDDEDSDELESDVGTDNVVEEDVVDDDVDNESDVESDVESEDNDAEDDGEKGVEIEEPTNTTKKQKQNPSKDDSDSESESDSDDDYLQKLDESVRHNIIGEYHPEMIQHNDEEIETLCKIVRDADGIIIDPFHKTLPFITKYEKARILGERAKQINSGAKPFITVEKHMIDGYLIALREFEERKIPFIVRRPLPNGGSEYWKLADLQILE